MIPAVSVLLPSYNYRRYVGEAIDSVMKQTCQDFELIIVDDGSQDGSLELSREWQARFPNQIRVFTHEGQKNLGLIKTYEEGLKHARGRMVAFLEADDVWHPENLAKKKQILETHPEVGVVYSRYRPFGWKRGVLYWKLYEAANAWGIKAARPLDLFDVFLKRNPVASFSHFVVRRELLEGIPPLKTMRSNNDWWILAHLSAKTYFYRLPDFLCFWRIHRSSLAHGPVDRRLLWKLRGFLLRLYRSPEMNRSGVDSRKKRLSWGLRFQEKLARKQWSVLWETLLHPIDLARFMCYFVLKKILFSSRAV